MRVIPTFQKLERDFNLLKADFHLKQKQYELAAKHLEIGAQLTKRKVEKYRYNFILGQIYQELGDDKTHLKNIQKSLKAIVTTKWVLMHVSI